MEEYSECNDLDQIFKYILRWTFESPLEKFDYALYLCWFALSLRSDSDLHDVLNNVGIFDLRWNEIEAWRNLLTTWTFRCHDPVEAPQLGLARRTIKFSFNIARNILHPCHRLNEERSSANLRLADFLAQ